jgi:hypothetical protein
MRLFPPTGNVVPERQTAPFQQFSLHKDILLTVAFFARAQNSHARTHSGTPFVGARKQFSFRQEKVIFPLPGQLLNRFNNLLPAGDSCPE